MSRRAARAKPGIHPTEGRLPYKWVPTFSGAGCQLFRNFFGWPRTARRFLIDYQDRVLFGKDSWRPEEYPVYFRVLETADEYFDYYRRRHAFWKMYGLDLPDEVLKKIYYKNALRIVPGLDASAFPE